MNGLAGTGETEIFWPDYVGQVLSRLTTEGFSAHVVGGSVRDYLLGRQTHDYDIATSARPEEVAQLFHGTVPTGVRHGTVTVVEFASPVEVTTYRRDDGYSDGRHPDVVEFTTSLLTDLSRRDFTVNAMAVTPTGQLVDPYHGVDDLSQRCIRAVGQPIDRFREDALRILRGLRFCAELAFTLDSDTERAMAQTSQGLMRISTERIGQEFRSLAAGNWPVVLRQLAEGPYLLNFPPPWTSLRVGFSRLLADGWTENLWAQARRLFQTAWQAVDEPCRGGKHGHPSATPDFVLALTLFLARSGVGVDQLQQLGRQAAWGHKTTQLLRQSLETAMADPRKWEPALWRTTLFSRDRRAMLAGCFCLDVLDSVVDGNHVIETPRTALVQGLIKSQPLWSLQDLAVDGQDLVDLGATGPQVGALLSTLATSVLCEHLPNARQMLLTTARRLVKTNFGAQRE
ncbi:CCA tRNA nucleotidyltransferase [Alicyclobacillus sp. ALC3]|uniref:CCA tRNA nucleotidyltransferase n=1 Tax=Alicyclobacillus sp. ALC3 TaxID=2796143 RepID=UPI0023782530|nr:hypothetical protein [Alicyclobacillus sp. ALC3]WDL97224.1 hypothetical protein JC200_00210 [Alicyclobacillus sp. ALC3]